MNEEKLKFCKMGSHEVARNLFHNKKSEKDGLNPSCKECVNGRAKRIRVEKFGPSKWEKKTEEPPAGTKWCRYKDHYVELENFGRTNGKINTYCKNCINERAYLQKYGITIENKELMIESQGRVCPGCQRHEVEFSFDWAVDHDHNCCPSYTKTCGECIRGMICRGCNLALGWVRDEPETLIRLSQYLLKKI